MIRLPQIDLPISCRSVMSGVMVASVLLAVPVEAAQNRDRTTPPGGQISNARTGDVQTVPQIAPERDRPATVQQPERAAPLSGAAQIAPVDRRMPLPQVSAPASPLVPTPQASRGDRSVQAGERLTQPKESRNVATSRIAGADRCDPQNPAASGSSVCQQVIEARADSFATERPDLSPEERLLVERYTPQQERGILAEVQRVGRDQVDASSVDTQALATVVLGQPVPDPVPAENTAEAGDPVIVNDLLNAVIDQTSAGSR